MFNKYTFCVELSLNLICTFYHRQLQQIHNIISSTYGNTNNLCTWIYEVKMASLLMTCAFVTKFNINYRNPAQLHVLENDVIQFPFHNRRIMGVHFTRILCINQNSTLQNLTVCSTIVAGAQCLEVGWWLLRDTCSCAYPLFYRL
jgi:hypothetical protein